MAIWLLFTMLLPVGASKCGVAATTFFECANCIDTAVNCGMDFWWNWGPEPTSPKVSGTTYKGAEFVPMIWSSGYGGIDNTTELIPLTKGKYLMGWNEPDHYGPPCWNKADVGGWVYPGCDGHSYSSAASSGTFLPYFNPTSGYAGIAWSDLINQLLRSGLPMPQIVSPSMAGPAVGGDKLAACKLVTNESLAKDPQQIYELGNCNGWLGEFKKSTLAMKCGTTNCWDIISHIQIHSYDYHAKDAIADIEEYLTTFKEDFQGLNGRSKKTLWLTETAGAYDTAEDQAAYIRDLIPYINSKEEIFRVSWFNEWSFSSFTIDNIPPKTPNWASSLFDPYGGLSQVGVEYFKQCNGGTLPSGCQ